MTSISSISAPAPPGELHDHSDAGWPIIALRIDGPDDTRGKAKSFFAREAGCDFTLIRVRKAYMRLDTEYATEAEADGIPEPYDGWPWQTCRPDAEGAHPYWLLVEDSWSRVYR